MSTSGKSSKRDDAAEDGAKSFFEDRPTHRNALNGRWRPRIKVLLAGAFLVGAATLSFGAYFSRGQSSQLSSAGTNSGLLQTTEPGRQPSTPAVNGEGSIIAQIFGSVISSAEESPPESWPMYGARVTLRLLLAALLAAMLAFRPHKYIPAPGRNPFVAETQILLAVVASALMMVVGDNAARAFGIFAAASLVRFRTNIRDPKETTVLLINLAIGLATGVGRWELALILSVFVLASLWILEYVESRQTVRSMQLKVKTHHVTDTDEVLRKIFSRHKLIAEVRQLDREDDEDPLGRIVYHLTGKPYVSTDELSEEIFAADPQNIDTVEWHQKKNVLYSYR